MLLLEKLELVSSPQAPLLPIVSHQSRQSFALSARALQTFGFVTAGIQNFNLE